MYFWSLKKLATAIANGALSEKSKLLNLISSVILLLILTLVNVANTSKTTLMNNLLLNIISIVNLLVLLAGIIYCYLQNKAVDNSNFIERFILFSLPSAVRVIVVTFVLGIFIGFIQSTLRLPADSIFFKIQLGGIGIGCTFLFFLWIANGIAMIGKIKPTNCQLKNGF